MDINEKLNVLFSDPNFFEEGKDVQNVKDFVELLSTHGIQLSEEEADAVLAQVGALLAEKKGELSENELENVSGGSALLVIGGITVKITSVAAQIVLGASIGAVAGIALVAIGCYYARKKGWI